MRVREAVRGAAQVRRFRKIDPVVRDFRLASNNAVGVQSRRVIAIGASTGGTEAVHAVLRDLPTTCPGVLVVIHMPPVFTAAYAARLDTLCGIAVREARSGEPILDGTAYIAPGDQHLKLALRNGRLVTQLAAGPPVSHHKPSVDVLFQSVAETAAARAMGIILTGMGEDGASGLRAMRDQGSLTVAQDEETSAVFGMPRQAIENGAASTVLPIDRIGFAIRAWASKRIP